MKTNINTCIGRFAVAAVAAFAVVSISAVAAKADQSTAGSATQNAWSVPVAHLGPGVGSVKSYPYNHIDSANAPSTTVALFFHVQGSTVPLSTSGQPLGPGTLSSKAGGER